MAEATDGEGEKERQEKQKERAEKGEAKDQRSDEEMAESSNSSSILHPVSCSKLRVHSDSTAPHSPSWPLGCFHCAPCCR